MNIYLTFHWTKILITASVIECNTEFFITSRSKNISNANIFFARRHRRRRRFSFALRNPSTIWEAKVRSYGLSSSCITEDFGGASGGRALCGSREVTPRPRAIDSLKLLVTQSPQAPARNNSHCLTRRPCRSLALFARSNFRPSRDDETRLRHLAFTASRTARCN